MADLPITLTVVLLFFQYVAMARSQARMEKRLRDMEVRFEKLLLHVGFVADPNPPITDDVQVLARTPGAKVAAIKAYRAQTGAGLLEAKQAVERMAQPPIQ
jgi:hypothetical protein